MKFSSYQKCMQSIFSFFFEQKNNYQIIFIKLINYYFLRTYSYNWFIQIQFWISAIQNIIEISESYTHHSYSHSPTHHGASPFRKPEKSSQHTVHRPFDKKSKIAQWQRHIKPEPVVNHSIWWTGPAPPGAPSEARAGPLGAEHQSLRRLFSA